VITKKEIHKNLINQINEVQNSVLNKYKSETDRFEELRVRVQKTLLAADEAIKNAEALVSADRAYYNNL